MTSFSCGVRGRLLNRGRRGGGSGVVDGDRLRRARCRKVQGAVGHPDLHGVRPVADVARVERAYLTRSIGWDKGKE